MRQTTTAKVRLDAGKAARFSASAQSTDWFDSCCARGARFTVAQDGRWGDPWPPNHAESGECRFIAEDQAPIRQLPRPPADHDRGNPLLSSPADSEQ
jgi:hypothetical protein